MLRKYFRNTGILGITELILRLKGLVLLPILTKSFGAVSYGIWAQVSVIVGMLMPLLVLGTDSAAIRFLSGQSKQEIRNGFITLLLYYGLMSFALGMILWILARPIAGTFFDSQANARYITLCGGVIFAGLVTNACRSFYRINGDGGVFAIINIAQSLYSAGIALGVAISHGTIFQVVFLGLLADLLLSGILIAHILLSKGLGRPNLKLLRNFIKFGLPLVPAGYAIWVLNMADRLFITHYGTLEDLGVYSVIYSLGYMFITLIFNPIWLMYPSAASELYNQNRLDELSRLFRYSTSLALAFLIPAIVGFGVLAQPLILVLATEEFVRGAILVPVVTLAYTLLMLSAYYEVSLMLVGRQIWSTINTVIAAGVNIALNFLLIPKWGITGAAWATAIGFAVQFALSAWMGSRQIRLQFDWRFFVKVSLASLGMVLILWLLPEFPSNWFIFVDVLVGILAYGIIMLLLRAISPADWNLILQSNRWDAIKENGLMRLILGLGNQ